MKNIPTQLYPARQFWRGLALAVVVMFLGFAITFASLAAHYRYIPPPATVPAQPAVTTGGHPAPKFLIGCFEQPTYNFDDLKILGFNSLVGIPMNHDSLQWAKDATAKGFYQIRPPVGVKSLDELNPLWIAWENPDEPDLHATPQATIDDNYNKARAIGIPTFTNLDGSRVLGIQPPAFGVGANYINLLAKTDWGCSDVYPVSGWNHNLSLYAPGHATDAMRVIGGDTGKQYFMYIECCQQDKWPSPTVDEMRIILKQAERRKLRGVIFFSFNFNLKWGGEPGKPNAFFGLDDEHREAVAEFNDSHQ